MITEFLLTTFVIFLSALYVPENQDISQFLKQLDAILSQKETYSIQREKRVDEIKERLETEKLSADEGWLECGKIVDECDKMIYSRNIDTVFNFCFSSV